MFGNSKRRRFETLFQPHLDGAYNLARYLCGSAQDAEDIVQEAYLRAYRAFGGYNNSNSRAWILTITRNACYSWMRKHNASIHVPFDEEVHSVENSVLFSTTTQGEPLELIAEGECRRRQVRLAIESLPLEFREVTVLRELEELSYQDIGRVLDIPQGTVMSRLARARKRLRELLKAETAVAETDVNEKKVNEKRVSEKGANEKRANEKRVSENEQEGP